MMRKLITTVALICAPAVLIAADADEVLQPHFQFRHQEFILNQSLADNNTGLESESSSAFDRNNSLSGKLNQFDATISYPFTRRQSVNVDLGVNLRFINADLLQNDFSNRGQHELNTALPMFYANALFELPYNGLSASFGATHLEYEQYYALDYKAKLSYQWQNGLGLEGGWQHQQLSIDGHDIQADIENKGMFLDLKYRF